MHTRYPISILLLILSALSLQAKSPVLKRGAQLQLISNDFKFTEGPAKASNGDIYFTDQPNNQILKWDVREEKLSVFLTPAGRSNGLYFDAEGMLLACADEKNQMWRIAPDGSHSVIINDIEGQLANGPNDLWIDDLGGLFFTDPLYKRPYWQRSEDYIDGQKVYYLSPKGDLKVVADGFVRPNGVIGDIRDGKLYVADIGDDKTWKYDFDKEGELINKTLFTAMGSDGMTIDTKRNIYLTGKQGVYVFDEHGQQIELIKVPQPWTANVTIGGLTNSTLYITSSTGFYSIELKVKGL